MGDNNLDYKKAYDEFLEKQKEIEKREKEESQKREKEKEKAFQEILEEEREKAYKELLKEKEESQKREKEREKAYKELLKEKEERQKEIEKENEELLKEKEESQKRQKEIEKEKEELLKEKEERQKKEKERSIRHLIDNGIPKCIMTSTSQSTSNHESCQLKQNTWVGIPNFEDLLEKNGNKESSMLCFLKNSTFTARNEHDLYTFTTYIIEDALKLCGLEEELSIISQEDIIGLQPDYWLVKSKTNYIGLIEVKSSEHSFHDPKVIGQLFDYLIGLSYLFGKLQAFGLLLTHNQVMPLFTQDSLELAANHIQSTPPHATSALPNQISKTAKVKPNTKVFDRVLYTSSSSNQSILSNISPTSSSSNTTSPPTSNSSSNTTSPAFSSSNTTSPILSSSSPVRDIEKPREFFELICSTIFKMRESQFDPNKEGTRFRVYLQANSLCFKAKSVKISTRKDLTDLNKTDNKLLDEIYLVKYLGGGGDGHCSYALTEKGHSLVIKSFRNTITKEKIEEERRLWDTIWGIKTILKTYSAKDHLVMPYLKPIENDDYNSADFNNLISTAADTFSSKGYEHMDLHIRHICKYKENDKNKYIFIDLSRVSEATDKNKAKQRMIKSILDDLKNIRYDESLTNKEQPNCPIPTRFSNPFTVPSTPNDKSKK
ncbi:hypothetical protein ACTFIY_011754 [Dictyostelium cf. discoideum]